MKRKHIISLLAVLLLFTVCISTIGAATKGFSFSSNIGGVSIAYKDLSGYMRTGMSSTVSRAKFGVDWKTSTQNGGPGPYKIWVRLANGEGDFSDGKLIGYLYSVSGIPAGFAYTSGMTVALQGHREHIGNPVEKITGSFSVSN